MYPFHGMIGFPITPADTHGRIDTAAITRLVQRQLSAGADAIGILGSTGSYPYLSREERRRALDAAVDAADGRVPVIAGVGALRTSDAVAFAQDAKAAGCAAGLLSAMSYLPLSQTEVYEHFATVARMGELQICIYDNPGTTHFQFTDDLLERLARVENIAAIKNPTSSPEQTASHLEAQRLLLPSGFPIGYSGDWCCAEAMIAGADAWYSVLGGTLPVPCVAIVRAVQAGNGGEARRLNDTLQPVWDLFQKYTSYRTVYEMNCQLDLCEAVPPRPILPVCSAGKAEIASVLERLPVNYLK
ncbi:dihydrodipicolinate synthase family protein [Paracoccus cavernae]|uniref:Dihydrodipicolinate synthase family protein n=1 Tax=Paracoccus cavernae TaxID=1571207 RepID=A0ABT8DHT8_9RHOB|nr:dihydrodipicolinate synthase family protein [Paracoccus cavernae]